MTSVRPRDFRDDILFVLGIAFVSFLVWMAVGIAAAIVSLLFLAHMAAVA